MSPDLDTNASRSPFHPGAILALTRPGIASAPRVLRLRSVFAFVATTALFAVVATLAAPTAPASSTHPLLGSFDGTGSTAGAFSGVDRLAFGQSPGSLYALDRGNQLTDKFDPSGTAQAFTDPGLGGATGLSVGAFGPDPDVAVDNSRTASDGNIYFISENQTMLYGFASTGATLSGFPKSLSGDTCGVAVAPSGHVWVADYNANIKEYDAAGNALAGQLDARGYCHIAFDSAGNLYAAEWGGRVHKFNPSGSSFVPDPTTPILDPSTPSKAIATDPATGHVYVVHPTNVKEYNASGDLVSSFGSGTLTDARGAAVDATSGKVYVSDNAGTGKVYIFGPAVTVPDVTTDSADNITATSATLHGTVNPASVQVTDCHFDYGTTASYGQTVPCAETVGSGTGDVAVHGDVSGLSPATTYHFRLVAANANGSSNGTDQTFSNGGPPEVASLPAAAITEASALIGGTVDPNHLPTTYYLEYSTDPGFSSSTSIPASQDADAGSGGDPVSVSRFATGLDPDSTYFFRLVAQNSAGTDTGDALSFHTLPAAGPPPACPNAAFRAGPSANLPDCRAYELVTPPDTNGSPPFGTLAGVGGFESDYAAPTGNAVAFRLLGGTLPGFDGNGHSDTYLAARGASGWSTTSNIVPTAAQGERADGGALSSDHNYSLWNVSGQGTLSVGPNQTHYLRNPDGSFDLLGHGSLGDDYQAIGRFITPGASHVIFSADVQLEPDAPAAVGPGGSIGLVFTNFAVGAVYDRTPTGLHVVSLLPGDLTPGPGTTTYYRGASADGSTVAFNVDDTMYLRQNDSTTVPVASSGPGDPADLVFAGISAHGDRVFYLRRNTATFPNAWVGDIFAFDSAGQQTTQITNTNDAFVVNASADGSHLYFVSPSQLDGANGAVGANNLYVWDAASAETHFIADLASGDVGQNAPSLRSWVNAVGAAQQANANGRAPADDPSRTTPDGSIIVFESRAQLTAYDNAGRVEVYRYHVGDPAPTCLSCNPLGAPASSDAKLEYNLGDLDLSLTPLGGLARLANVSQDGHTVFFLTAEPLVPSDLDGKQDVYEWHDGVVSLIGGGQSQGNDWLYGVSADGHDVFFTSGDQLVSAKQGGTPAVYDARVGGGFPSTEVQPCVGDACQGNPTPPPAEPGSGSSAFSGPGNQGRSHNPASSNAISCPKHKKLHNGKCIGKKHRRHR